MFFILRVKNPSNGVKLEVFSNENGVQLYTADNVNITKPSNGKSYTKHQGLCLETHNFIDSVNQVKINLKETSKFSILVDKLSTEKYALLLIGFKKGS